MNSLPRSMVLAWLAGLGALSASCREAAHTPPTGAAGAPEVVAKAGVQDAAAEAARVCRVLQGTPAERRAACCSGAKASSMEADCVRALSEALGAGRLAIDAERLAACGAASDAAFVGCDWVTPSQPVPPAECREVTRGLVAEGGACRSSLECTAPLHCEGVTPAQPGHCTAPLPDGAACRMPVELLGSYLFARELTRTRPTCSGVCSYTAHRCEAAPSLQCATDAECNGGQVCKERRCSPATASGQKAAGEVCQTDFDCRVGGCSGEPAKCGMKCAVSMADRTRSANLPPMVLPQRSAPAQEPRPALLQRPLKAPALKGAGAGGKSGSAPAPKP